MRLGAWIIALAVSVGVLGACGGETKTTAPQTVIGSLPAETTAELPPGDPTAGAEVFDSAGCGGCHVLSAAGSNGNVGPNLDEAIPEYALVVDRVTNGKGAMPAFADQLDEQQIADVAAYVVDSTGGQLPAGGSTTGGASAGTTGEATTGDETTEDGGSTTGGEGDAAAGKTIFTSAGCASCHTLADAGASGNVGPNLDDVQPPLELVVDRVTNGQGVMPSFKDQLSEQQIQDVATYVSQAAGS